MNWNNIRDEINRELEPTFRSIIDRIRAGEDPERPFRQFITTMNEKWTQKANEYQERMEEQRRIDQRDYEQRLRALKSVLAEERQKNTTLQGQFTLHLLNITEMHNDHEKFAEIRGEALIASFGRYSTALKNLLDRHDDVEFEKEKEKYEKLLELRMECQEVITKQFLELGSILTGRISTNLPVESICPNRDEILGEIRRMQTSLYDLNSLITSLTPEFWEDENLANINSLKDQLEETTGNVLRMMGEGEANHKRMLEEQMVFVPGRAINY